MKALLLVTLTACGGIETTSTDASVPDDGDAPVIDVSDASSDCAIVDASNCNVASNVLICKSGSIGAGCLGDVGDTCTLPADASCTAECTSSEYGAACGAPSPTASIDPPSSDCRTIMITPGNVAFYCCPSCE